MRLDSWSDTNIGLIRKSNQDSVGCFPELSLFLVADGMGGRAQGEVASRMAVEIIHECFADAPTLRQAIKDAQTLKSGGFLRTLLRRPSPAEPEPDGESVSPSERLRTAIELANAKIFEAGHTGDGSPAGLRRPPREIGAVVGHVQTQADGLAQAGSLPEQKKARHPQRVPGSLAYVRPWCRRLRPGRRGPRHPCHRKR